MGHVPYSVLLVEFCRLIYSGVTEKKDFNGKKFIGYDICNLYDDARKVYQLTDENE